jgi:hypothetical protein
MTVVYYKSVTAYIQSKTTLEAKIAVCQQIIDNMQMLILEFSINGNAGTGDYSLDNGQTQVKGTYRSVEDLSRSIQAIETMMWRWINQKEGRMTRLSDQANFRRKGGYGNGC